MQQHNTKNKMLKVAILGKLPSKYQAPFADTTWQIWGCNVHDMSKIPRFDLWFDIHRNPSNYTIPPDKLITRDKYPLEEVISLLGGNYLNNSISYMIMYAVLQGATDISLYGVSLSTGEEIRTKQLNNLREILFFCKGRGIKVSSIEENVLATYPLYGA